ncbi:hypothetical protein [Streptomyces tendae]|uniref:hypothetical protein n=1 Tax=Streptomyces tendae TaxID=1932 RepID=UPI003EBA93AF
MISFAQVVAAVATGALLTVAAMLVYRQYGAQHPAEKSTPGEGVDNDAEPDEPDDAEWKIEAARSLGFAAVETFRHHIAADPFEALPPDADRMRDPGVGAALVRSKGHLALVACGRRIEAGLVRPGALGEPRRLAEHQSRQR